MNRSWIIVLISTAGCIEGVDPNDCSGDSQCGGERVCNGLYRCVAPEEVRDLMVRWTIDGVAPTPAMPGRCAELAAFYVGAGGDGGGFAGQATCATGTAPLLHVPRDFTHVGAAAYRARFDGSLETVGEASTGLPIVGDEVTVDVRLRF